MKLGYKLLVPKEESMISIIIVNWNGKHLIGECLMSVMNQTCINSEIIVVDNNSVDGSVEFVKNNFPSVKIVSLNENKGFTGGNIEGLKHARGEFIVLLNNDAILSEKWLESMWTAINSDAKIGLCSSKIIIAGTNKIDSAGDVFTYAFTGTKIGEYQDEKVFSDRRLVPGACAAAVIYRRSMLDEIGFLDDSFYLNHEDTDLNLRAWLSGWRCLFVPEAIVYHKVSASIGNLSDTAVYYFARNTEWVWIKNVPLRLMIKYFPQRIIYEICSFGYFCVMKKKWRPFLKGKIDALLNLPLMLRKRKEVQRFIRLSDQEICAGLVPISTYLINRIEGINS